MTVLHHSRKMILSLWFFTGAALLPLSPARAGFEWTPPAAAPRSGPAVEAVPVPQVDVMPPVDAEPMAMPEMNLPGSLPVEAQPLAPPPFAPAAVSDDRDYAAAEGFGRDIPLALVMQQIVPPGYAYSFAPSVNPGIRVSWDGGRPWNHVLNDAVAPFGLEAVVKDMTVHLQEASAQKAMAAPAPLQTEPPPAGSTMRSMMSEIARAAEKAPAGIVRTEMPETAIDPARLAEIGSDASGYHPSYPRRVPPVKGSVPVQTPAVLAAAQPASEAETITFNGPRVETAPESRAPHPAENPFAAQAPMPITPAESAVVPPPRTFAASASEEPGSAPHLLDPHAVDSWRAANGASLKDTLTTWCEQAGVRLYWDAADEYKLPVAVNARATFPEILMQTLSAYGDAGDRPVGALHPNLPDGPSVLIIRSSGSAAAVN